MTTDRIPYAALAAEIDALFRCGYVLGEPEHPCGKSAVASAIGPHGERLPLCAKHERTALAAVSLPRFADWLVEDYT